MSVRRPLWPPRSSGGPPPSEGHIRAAALQGLRETLRPYGVKLPPLLARASIPADMLEDDFNWVPLERFAHVLTLAAEVTGDPCFGLKHGESAHFANPVGYLMSSAPDLRTALRAFSQHQRAFNTSAETFSEQGGTGQVEWAYPVTVSDATQLIDFVLMRFVGRIQLAAGASWRPLSVSLRHRELRDREAYERRLGPRIAFNQPLNRILIAGPTLNLRMPAADPDLFKLVKRFCEQQIEQQATADDSLNRTRQAVVRCFQRGDVSPRLVAAELAMPPGGLHRLLKERGTSFQRLLDDTRRCVAQRYLFESSLPLGEIATRVGYSELSAFSRAARRWFGCSPRDLRRNPTRRG